MQPGQDKAQSLVRDDILSLEDARDGLAETEEEQKQVKKVQAMSQVEQIWDVMLTTSIEGLMADGRVNQELKKQFQVTDGKAALPVTLMLKEGNQGSKLKQRLQEWKINFDVISEPDVLRLQAIKANQLACLLEDFNEDIEHVGNESVGRLAHPAPLQ
jgi:hypothetical protein